MDNPDRRQCRRFSVDSSAELIADSNAVDTIVIRDISARGVKIFGYRPLPVSSTVTIRFQMPSISARVITKQAKVAWACGVSDTAWESGLDFGPDNTLRMPM